MAYFYMVYIFGVVTHWSWPLILTSMDTLSRDSSNLLPNPWTLVNWYPKSTHWTKEFFPLYQISGGGGTHSFGSPATGKLKLFDGISWCFLPARFCEVPICGPQWFLYTRRFCWWPFWDGYVTSNRDIKRSQCITWYRFILIPMNFPYRVFAEDSVWVLPR